MKLKGGIIIIGSLLWDNSIKRKSWRNKYFKERRIKTSLPIRYGRISSSRMDTYTMIYSQNLLKDEYGQGIILEFKDPINSTEDMKQISENTIRVERDKTKEEWNVAKKGEPFILNWNWGVLGISINPKHEKSEKPPKDLSTILKFWKKSLANFNPEDFSLSDEIPIINKDGIFRINWDEPINDFDFIISTIIKPDPKTENGKHPDANLIAEKMYEGNYYSYFIKNIENEIKTNNDENIIELIKEKYCVSNYLKNLGKNKQEHSKRSEPVKVADNNIEK